MAEGWEQMGAMQSSCASLSVPAHLCQCLPSLCFLSDVGPDILSGDWAVKGLRERHGWWAQGPGASGGGGGGGHLV